MNSSTVTPISTMDKLSKALIPTDTPPERVLQFGTGVLLRGLPDYYINKANQQGTFNGSIVVVKSTDGSTDEFARQDNLYTLVVRGVQQGQPIAENTVVTAISRVWAAQTDWKEILRLAQNPDLQIIISNTTEVGIQYVEESIFQHPPQSYPAKLTAFLYEVFKNSGGSKKRGMVVIPTELITDNGLKLRDTVEKLAKYNELGRLFMKWLKYHVRFCNSLVDRIVTGRPDAERYQQLGQELGYEDNLLTMTEPYRLWAIEGDDRVKEMLSFAQADSSIIIEEDITFYRERKLRVLNGTHTLSVPLGYLMGMETVYENNHHPVMSRFVQQLMLTEIVPTVPTDTMPDAGPAAIEQFARDVLDRFRNPHIVHLLPNILTQQTSKMQARNVATIQRYYDKFGKLPQHMALGFAAYLLYMKAVNVEGNTYYGERSAAGQTQSYPIRDEKADYFYQLWQTVDVHDPASVRQFVHSVCADTMLWGADLSSLPDFADTVTEYLSDMVTLGVEATAAKWLPA
ncbi:tagaturonate reductase [Nibrella viscosa]|uniref:Tagaturonate reductase n=2 Tax=Nibrella viscosa TaxID=1084524 RepID=A0ABP8KA00_9BACT